MSWNHLLKMNMKRMTKRKETLSLAMRRMKSPHNCSSLFQAMITTIEVLHFTHHKNNNNDTSAAHEFVDEWHPYDEDHQFNPFPDEGQQHNNSPHNNQYSPSQHNNTFMQTIPLSFPQNNTTNYKPPDPQSNRSKKVSQRVYTSFHPSSLSLLSFSVFFTSLLTPSSFIHYLVGTQTSRME